LVEPAGYATMWQRFENNVYQVVKKHLVDKFRIEWQYEVSGLKPDVVCLLECDWCESKRNDYPCVTPAFIFDACHMFKIKKSYFVAKDKQMKKYSKVCDSILVLPQGYEQRPYCRSKNGEYHIISFHYLLTLLECIAEESIISSVEDVCGYVPSCNSENVYPQFELSIRSRVDKCPNCNSKVLPISLIYCSQYDEYYYPDFLDTEVIDHKGIVYTYAECDGCGNRNMFGWNYDSCPHSGIEHMYQCKKCGAIFNPETRKTIENFEISHRDEMGESFSYYESNSQ